MGPKKVPVAYKYTKLNDLTVGKDFNVFGVLVEVIKESVPTDSNLRLSIYHIMDESLPPDQLYFRVSCFVNINVHLPKFCVGDIMRFHRVQVETWSKGLDGRIFNATDVVGFSSDPTSGFEGTSLAKAITMSDESRERISELREVAALRTVFDSLETMSMNGTPPNETPNILTQPSVIQADVVASSGKIFPNPAADGFKIGSLFRNPFYYGNLKKDNTEAGPSRKRSSSELGTPVEEAESTVSIGKTQASLSKKRKKYKPCPLSKKRQHVGEEPFSSKNSETGKLYSQAMMAQEETGGDQSREQNSAEPNISVEETESCVFENKQANLTENVTMFKEPKPHPMSKPNRSIGKPCSLSHETLDSEELSSAAVLARTVNRQPNEPNEVPSDGSVQAESSSCPGIICAHENCGQEPIIIESDADDLDPEDPLFMDGPEIPAADDQGNIFLSPKWMNFKVEENNVYIDAASVENFKWPCYSSKVRIIGIRPNLKVLKTKGPKNLLSGACEKCGTFTVYSKLLWDMNKDTATKIALCPMCCKTGATSRIKIDFRLQLTIQDAWGTTLNVFATRENAAKFLGCTQSQYHSSNECRQRIIDLLSEALSSKYLRTVGLYCVTTFSGKKMFIYDTELSKVPKSNF